MRISILGSGNFGTALAKVFSKKNDVHIYSIDEQAIDSITKYRENVRYLPGVTLNKRVTITGNLADVQESDIIIFCVPSSVYELVAKKLRPYYNGQIIISASKGIGESGEHLTDIIEKNLKCNKRKVLAISGPSIASELARGKATQVILGGDRNFTQIARDVLETDTFFIRATRDKSGIQLLGFYKNILAILVGLCDGLDLGNNFKSALVTKAYSEFYYLNENKNIRRHSFIDYAGLGDLYVTSTCPDSRNRKFGYLLAREGTVSAAKKEIGQVIEGLDNLARLSVQKDCSWFETNLIKTLVAVVNSRAASKKKKLLLKYLQSSEIKAIVFDWGNVITKDYYSMHVAKKLSKKCGVDSHEVLDVLERHERGVLLGEEKFNVYFKKVQVELPELKYSDFLAAYKSSVTWNAEVLKICRKLSKKYDLYILSNNYNLVMPLIKPRLQAIFKGMIFSNEVNLIKPNNDIFEHLLSKFDLRPENCIYVDDSHSNIMSAERNKFNVVEFDSVETLEKVLGEKIVGFE